MATATFLFVDGLSADRSARKRLRQHVMKGKNAGRKLNRRSRISPIATTPPGLPLSCLAFNRANFSLAKHVKNFGVTLRSLPFPTEVTSRDLRTIDEFYSCIADRVYHNGLPLSTKSVASVWLELLFCDVGTFNCTLNMMEASTEVLRQSGMAKATPTALSYQSKAYAIVNERLRGPEGLNNSTIWVITLLIHQEYLNQRYDIAELHAKGVQRIIKMRGGLEKLEDNRPLVLKLCKADIMLSLQTGTKPLYYRDQFPQLCWKLELDGLPLDTFSAAASIESPIEAGLMGTLRDLKSVCVMFNQNKLSYKTEVYDFVDMVLSFMYRLLRFRGVNEVPEGEADITTIFHSTLLLFVMSTIVQTDFRRAIKCEAAAKDAETILRSLDMSSDADLEVKLWALVVGSIWFTADGDVQWIIERINVIKVKLGISSWQEARDVLVEFPWLSPLHDQPGEATWTMTN